MAATQSTPLKAPSLVLLGLEPLRATAAFLHGQLAAPDELPAGDGSPVLVIPGLATNALATGMLRKRLTELGYQAQDWGQGLNTGPKDEDLDAWLAPVAERLEAITDDAGQPAQLVGWSLGGIVARELAKRKPKLASRVITLGTPFAGMESSTNAGLAYELLNGGRKAVLSEALSRQLRSEPPVPSVSLYSKSDGVVSWQACVQPRARRTRHVEVPGVSHFGLVWSPKVLSALAHELARPRQG